MVNGQGLEVILDTRKAVVANNPRENLDILLRLRAPVMQGEATRTP